MVSYMDQLYLGRSLEITTFSRQYGGWIPQSLGILGTRCPLISSMRSTVSMCSYWRIHSCDFCLPPLLNGVNCFAFSGKDAEHSHHVPLVSPIRLPQGDPASPLMLLIILRVGYYLVNEGLGVDNVFQSIHVDDHTVVTNSRERVQLAAIIWRQFATIMHLKENDMKTQFVDINGPASDCFQPWLEPLGACIKALSTLKKISILPLSVRMKMNDAVVFGKSRLSYGWTRDF